MPDTITIRDANGVLVDVSVDDLATLNGAPTTAHAQRFKATYGADGDANDVSLANPMPVAPSGAGDVAGTLTPGRQTVTTPGTAVAIRASLPCKWVQVTALKTNTGQVNVGGAGVSAVSGSSTGDPLNAGESVSYPVDNANKVFVDARVAGEGVSFTVGSP